MDPKTALQRAETLMLDMDGTLLDLAYDNYIWKDLVPRHYAVQNDMAFEDARDHLLGQYQAVLGDLKWYCLDHWCERLGVDVVQLHRDADDRIDYLPGALAFLKAVQQKDMQVLLVTNSHPDTLELKDTVTGLGEYFDGVFTSHNYGHAKESQAFWHALQDDIGFDIDTTMFVDDSQPVLRSAAEYGLEMLVTVTRPDSTRPVKERSEFRGVETVEELL